MSVKVAVCQVPDVREDIDSSLRWVEKFAGRAEGEGVSLICFPECFLQGYLTEKLSVEKYAVNTSSPTFEKICARLSKFKPAIVFGMIEEDEGLIHNTAVVLKRGNFLGKYRKTHLLDGERIFTAGTDYPAFETNGLRFGINICYDTQFAKPAARLAAQAVKLILCPSNNMMRYKTAEKYKHLHHKIRIERAKENKIWLLSSDVTGERDGRIAYGPTSAINPQGQITAQVPLMKTGMIVVEI
jgi:predicted amidohydrolase